MSIEKLRADIAAEQERRWYTSWKKEEVGGPWLDILRALLDEHEHMEDLGADSQAIWKRAGQLIQRYGEGE